MGKNMICKRNKNLHTDVMLATYVHTSMLKLESERVVKILGFENENWDTYPRVIMVYL